MLMGYRSHDFSALDKLAKNDRHQQHLDASLQIPIVYWWFKNICQALTRQLRCELQVEVTGFVSL